MGKSQRLSVLGIPAFAISAILWVALIVICGVVAIMLKGSFDVETMKASAEGSNLAAALSQDITRNLEIYDLSIQGVIEALKDAEVMTTPPRIRQMILFDRAATAPFLGEIFVLDRSGDIAIESASVSLQKFNYADREYFKVQAERSDVGLFVSKPLRSRSTGQMMIALSRRLDKPDGTFGGIVIGTLRLEYIHNLLARMRLGAQGSITLFRTDGTIVMREPYNEAEIGRILQPKPLFDRLATANEGEYTAVSVYDGVKRRFHYQRVGNLPLVLNVGLSLQDVYADWWRKAVGIACVLAICCAIVVVLAAALKKELNCRIIAEAALVILAKEDSLTGIANRRRFDEVLEAEWRVAIRSGTPLSLLMIDVDRFKAFNDALGHLAGDEALAALGPCLAATIRREGDLAARYGGEEFAVVLPHTDSRGAMKVAEILRHAVERLAIPHPGARQTMLSVSIGVATSLPTLEHSASDLIAAADQALYCAKAEGRNRACAHNLEQALSAA